MSTKRYVFGKCGCCKVSGPQMIWRQRYPLTYREVVDESLKRYEPPRPPFNTAKFDNLILTGLDQYGPEHTNLSGTRPCVNPHTGIAAVGSDGGFERKDGQDWWYAMSEEIFEPGSYVIDVTSEISKPLRALEYDFDGGPVGPPLQAIFVTPMLANGRTGHEENVGISLIIPAVATAVYYPTGGPPKEEARFSMDTRFRFGIQWLNISTEHLRPDSDALWTITISITAIITARDA